MADRDRGRRESWARARLTCMGNPREWLQRAQRKEPSLLRSVVALVTDKETRCACRSEGVAAKLSVSAEKTSSCFMGANSLLGPSLSMLRSSIGCAATLDVDNIPRHAACGRLPEVSSWPSC